MTLLGYQIFHAVAQQGSFARAAGQMHLTPSAISHAVAAMEEEIGFPLFIRSKSGVNLTSGGQELYPCIEQVLRSNELLMQSVAQINGIQRGTVKIGCFSSVCVSWLPQIITGFKKQFPAIDIEVHQGGYNSVAEWLKSGEVDLGFLSASSGYELDMNVLYRDRLVCVAPQSFVPLHGDYITVEELRDQQFVIQSAGVNDDVRSFLKKYRLQVHTNCHVRDDLSTVAMVESGLGICIMPRLAMQGIATQVKLYPIQPAEHREIAIACLDRGALAPAARQMYQYICQTVPDIVEPGE